MSSKLFARMQKFPHSPVMSGEEAIAYMRRKVFDDALKAGDLKPCRREGRMVFYRTTDVMNILNGIASGQYPGASN